jgi:formylglycine-generating enzyme required for sulfatase activity
MSRTLLCVRLSVSAALALAGLLVLWPSSGKEAADQSKAYALLIGVKTFDQGMRYRLRPLGFTENDVEDLAKVLDTPGSPFHGLRPDGKTPRIRVLTSTRGGKSAGDKPTAANIRKELQDLTSERRRTETVLVVVASHGFELVVSPPGAGGRGGLARGEGEAAPDDRIYPFFCPSDAQLDGTDYATGDNQHLINLDKLYIDTLGKCGAGTKLLVVDACRKLDKVPAARLLSVNYKAKLVPEGMGVMFSCKSGQVADEHPDLQHGIFSYFLLKGLRGEAKDPTSGEVTWKTLDRYVVNAMVSESSTYTGGTLQTPHSLANFVGSDPILARIERSSLAKNNGPPEKDFGRLSRPGGQGAGKGVKNSIGMMLMPIPKGKFFMGSRRGAVGDKDEKQHEVEIPAELYMGAYEVTQEEYHAVMRTNPSAYSEGGVQQSSVRARDTSRFPVESVSWSDAEAFCNTLSELRGERAAGRRYRLPTEAEWEYACRGGKRDARPFHLGNTLSAGQANFDCRLPFGGGEPHNSLNHPCEVGTFEPNFFGLYDMHGNVREWCSDWYDSEYYKDSPKSDPQGPPKGRHRVARGGSWMQDGISCRSMKRDHLKPDYTDHYTGFRVVCVRGP